MSFAPSPGRAGATRGGANPRPVAEVPDQLTLEGHRDLDGDLGVWARRVGLGILVAVLLLGLANLFGQRPSDTRAAAPEAELSVYAPTRVRGGLFYEARFTVEATEELREATLVLDSGWAEGITINTIVPSPLGEASRDGKLVFELGHVPRGDKHVLYIQLQVNPTNIGRRSQDVWLYDGDTEVAHVDRSISVWP